MDKMYHIIHHNDEDGIVSAAVIYCYLIKVGVPDNHICFYKVDYKDDLSAIFPTGPIRKDDEVFVVDYSFSNEDNFDYILKCSKSLREITWIDHHKTSIDLIAKRKEDLKACTSMIRIINTAYCSAVGCYWYAYSKLHTYKCLTIDDIKIPLFIQYVNAWDTGKWDAFKNLKEFHFGMISYPHTPRDIFNAVYAKYEFYLPGHIFDYPDEMAKVDKNFIDSIIRKGKPIVQYNAQQNKYLMDTYGYFCTINDEINHREYTCAVLNTRGNSTVFGDTINDVDIVIPYIFDGNIYTYSLFSNKEGIDCAELAKLFGSTYLGGGGHKSAAGFQHTHQLFFSESETTIAKSFFGNKVSIHIARACV